MPVSFKNKKQLLQPLKTANNGEAGGLDAGLERLRIAILRQAVLDYVKALREDDGNEIYKLERFFMSDWGQLLSDYHGEQIIAIAKRKAKKGLSRVQHYATLP